MPLKLERRPGGENWYLRGTIRGIRVRESCGTDDRKAAEQIKTKREWELLHRSVFGVETSHSFLAAVAVYLENGGERRFLQPLIEHFKTTPINKIDQAAIDAAGRAIYPGLSPATISRQVYTPMGAIINAAADRKMCAPIRLKRPKTPRGRVRWLTQDEAAHLIDACAPHLKPLVAFLFYTGARMGEALWLDWRYVDLKRRQVQFLDTKNGTDRGVPLHPDLVVILANLPHREGCVFRKPGRWIVPEGSNSGEKVQLLGEPYAPLDDDNDFDVSAGSRIKKGFRAACIRAEIDDFSPHDCRHTWATWHYMENRDLNLLMHLGGWSTLAMVLRYAHVNVAHAAPSIDAMPSIRATAKPVRKVPGRKASRQKSVKASTQPAKRKVANG